MKNRGIKEVSAMLLMIIVICACNGSNSPSKESRPDSSKNNQTMEPQSIPDSVAQKGDTALYERMPLKTSDSTPQ